MKVKLDKWQKDFLETKGDKILCTGRQVGKTRICAKDAGDWATHNKSTVVLMIAPTERQARNLFDMTLEYLVDNYPRMIKMGKDRPTKSRLRMKNKSVINFAGSAAARMRLWLFWPDWCGQVGVSAVQFFRHDDPQYGVSEKLQTFIAFVVGAFVFVDIRGMQEGLVKEVQIDELKTQLPGKRRQLFASVIIQNHDLAGRGLMPGARIARSSPDAASVNPEGAMPVVVIQKAVRNKQMRIIPALLSDVNVMNPPALALQVKRLGPHEEELALAAENVRGSNRHIQHPDMGMQVLARIGILFIHLHLRKDLAGRRVETIERETAIKEHGSARDHVGNIIPNEHAAMHRPDRFQLFPCRQSRLRYACFGITPPHFIHCSSL